MRGTVWELLVRVHLVLLLLGRWQSLTSGSIQQGKITHSLTRKQKKEKETRESDNPLQRQLQMSWVPPTVRLLSAIIPRKHHPGTRPLTQELLGGHSSS